MSTSLFIKSDLLSQDKSLIHAFSTAAGGIEKSGKEVKRELLAALGKDNWPVFRLQQVHGDKIVQLKEVATLTNLTKADGLISNLNNIFLAVLSADCLPILFCDAESGYFGALHAGWQGTLKGIAQRACLLLKNEFGSSLTNVHFALGPAIGSCCYQVGKERIELFLKSKLFADCPDLGQMANNSCLDLAQLNRYLLQQNGIKGEQIDSLGHCTCCEAEKFVSFRREKEKNKRQINLIAKLAKRYSK